MDVRWPLAVAIFLLTYTLIATRRLALVPIGRPAGALLGAVLMVATGVITPAESFAAIDADTILLLFGMMLLSVYLDRAGLFDRLAAVLLRSARTPWRLLAGVSIGAALLSAVLVNDTVCLFLTPVVVATCARAGLPMGPYLIALATSANIGSAATLVGNPQNMIIGSLSGIPFARFAALVGPAAAVGLAANIALLWLAFGRKLPRTMPAPGRPTPHEAKPGTTLAAIVTCAIILCFFMGFHMGYSTLAGVMVFVLADRHDPRPTFARVDWPLLVFFAGLFVVVGGLASTGIVERARDVAATLLDLHSAPGLFGFTTAMSIGSNVFSNVPMVLLTGPELSQMGGGELGWALLGFTTTVAGNLTLLGSVANIIVAEGARDHYTLGFVEYLRFGLLSTVVVLAVGVPMVVWTAG